MSAPRRVCIVTGSRAEWGLLRPVAAAIAARAPRLELQIVVAGSHLMPPAETWREVGPWPVAAKVKMQTPGLTGRAADAAALGRGVLGCADAFEALRPDWVVVLGDRIEAFAAASAASVGGWALAHIHGGDRAEGIADEAMRHAISKLAHLHCAATEQSAQRLIRMGEPSERVICTGSPAIDGLENIAPLKDEQFNALGRPRVVVLLHPAGLTAAEESSTAAAVAQAVGTRGVLWLAPNHDPGREHIVRAMQDASVRGVELRDHLERPLFVGLLKRIAADGGVIVGNSSAGLIEAAALRCPAVDVGPRQAGRERPDNVVHVGSVDSRLIAAAIERARTINREALSHPYADGGAGERIADRLASLDPAIPGLLRKRNAY